MSRNKIMALVVGAVLLAGVVVTGVSLAGPYAERCMSRGPEFFMSRMDERVAELNLTPEQQANYQNLKEDLRERMMQGRDQRKEFLARLKAQLAVTNPDLNLVAGMVKDKMTSFAGTLGQGLDLFLEFYNTLNPEQQQMVLERMRERIEQAEKFGCRWHRQG